MKKYLFITSILLSVNVLSCQDDVSKNVNDTLLRTIAIDADYIAFQKAGNERAYHVTVKTWDTKDVIDLLNNNVFDSCDIPASEFEKMKGGKIYWELDCRMVTLLNKLNVKFDFSSFSDTERDRIRAYYKENDGYKDDEELRNKIIQFLNKN